MDPWALVVTERFLRESTGRKGAQKGEEEGWPAKGAKRKKDS